MIVEKLFLNTDWKSLKFQENKNSMNSIQQSQIKFDQNWKSKKKKKFMLILCFLRFMCFFNNFPRFMLFLWWILIFILKRTPYCLRCKFSSPCQWHHLSEPSEEIPEKKKCQLWTIKIFFERQRQKFLLVWEFFVCIQTSKGMHHFKLCCF